MKLGLKRRFAAHRIVNGQHSIDLGVVELIDGCVCDCYPLEEELAQTEWVSGTIYLREASNGKCHAYYNGQRLI